MKINSIQRDISLKHGGSGVRSKHGKDKYDAPMCANNTINNEGYCGSFTGKSETAATVLNKVNKTADTFLDKILKSNWFGKFTQYAEAHNIASSALIALILAGVMRPATIMALPGDKDKDDKIYASGHAMASGIMGFAVSTAITSPFDESIKKIFDNDKFVGKKLAGMNEQIKALKEKASLTDAEKLSLKALKAKRNAMKTLAKNIPDWIIAIPRSVLTIALIPPILKYVFGVEKKKAKPEAAVVQAKSQDSNFIEKPVFAAFKGKDVKSNKPAFGSAQNVVEKTADEIMRDVAIKESGFFKPFEDFYERLTNKIAEKFTSKYVEAKPIEYLADKFKDSKNLYQHCLTVGSVITSGLYMERTYTNKKLDKDRRNTLVVNQGLTLALSTAGAYMLDKYLSGWWDNVTARFAGHLLAEKGEKDFYKNYLAKKADTQEKNEVLKATKGKNAELKTMKSVSDMVKETETYMQMIGKDATEMSKQEARTITKKIKGIGLLKSMIVFGFVYRFFVPVVVTKPANKLCDMYLEHKKAKEAAKQAA